MSLRSTFNKYFVAFLHRKGFQIIKDDELKLLTAHYWNVSIKKKNSNKQNKIDSIVFSKNRATQLCAFLESYEKMVSNRGIMYILYKASNKRHKQSYLELQQIFNNKDFIFIEEVDFRQQLIEISENSDAKTIAIYVDDEIFLINIDYDKIKYFDMEKYVVALSRGKDMDEHPGFNLILPEFEKREDGFESFRWDYSDSFSHWTYPVGVSAYFYDINEWIVMLRSTIFKTPSSLEGNLQKFVPLFKQREGLCLSQIACVCVHANLVTTECVNDITGTHTVEELLDKWEKGFKIDLNEFYGKSGKISQHQSFSFVKR